MAGQATSGADNTLPRHLCGSRRGEGAKRPSHRPGSPRHPGEERDLPIGRDAAAGDLADNCINPVEETHLGSRAGDGLSSGQVSSRDRAVDAPQADRQAAEA